MDLFLDECLDCGPERGGGNLLGIQPYLLPADYASTDWLRRKLGAYLEAARGLGWLGEKTVVVLPEYTAAWLAATGESMKVYEAAASHVAMRSLLFSRPLDALWAILRARENDRLTAAVFRIKALETARQIQTLFGGLAREYGVTLAAGSAILPAPVVEAGELRVGNGPLKNTAFLFRPDGSLHTDLTRKAYPIASELPFVAPAACTELPVYDTPAGRLGLLICADSWYPEPYRVLREQGASLLAVLSFLSGNGAWERRWGGYDGSVAPEDVDPSDVGSLSEGQAWHRYALKGRMSGSGALAGINVFLHGKMWDLGSDSGQSLALGPCGQVETSSRRAALVNCRL